MPNGPHKRAGCLAVLLIVLAGSCAPQPEAASRLATPTPAPPPTPRAAVPAVGQVRWELVPTSGPTPSPRLGATFAFLYARGQLLLFGGRAVDQPLAELWRYDTERERWSLLTAAPSPPARWGHAVAVDSRRRVMVIFGGQGSDGTLNDLWAFDPLRLRWQQLARDRVGPGPRVGACAAYDETGDTILLAFGSTGSSLRNDLWAYRPDSESWEELSPPLLRPPARQDAACLWDASGRRLYVFGGRGEEDLADGWVFSLAPPGWTPLPSPLPPLALAATAVGDNGRGLIIGGQSAGGLLAEVWQLTFADGTLARLHATGPPPRAGAAAVYSSDTRRFYLFGGAGPSPLDDFWSWAP